MKVSPFSISPDPELLYVTPSIEATLDKVRHLVDYRQGLTTIVGDVGHGKSTILRYIWRELGGNSEVRTGAVITPNFTSDFAFLKAVCGEFGIPPKRSMQAQESALREFLVGLDGEGQTAVLLIDEAQKLPGKQLELIRVLLNFERETHKLVQIVLAGQLELKYKLLDESKKAIRSRVFAPSNLSPLSPDECREMIQFRCDKFEVPNPFASATVDAIYNQTSGVPRDVLKMAQILWVTAQRARQEQIPVEWVEPALSEAVLNA
jgi:general secretion pathway protein A